MSMKDAGILDGDLVAVHRTSEVRNRQIIVARLENEVTVKRYRQQGSVVWLLPENSDFEPIRVDLQQRADADRGRRGRGAAARRPVRDRVRLSARSARPSGLRRGCPSPMS